MTRTQKAKLPLTLLVAALAMVCVAALAPAPAQANGLTYVTTLTSGNSAVTGDSSLGGLYDWTLAGKPYMWNEMFYFKLPGENVQSIGVLPLISYVNTGN
jgi:hypothetical protein